MNYREYQFQEHIVSNMKEISEVLIQFGGAGDSQFGNVLIMAGGAGSGKGFVLKNLIGLEGKVLDVDALKAAAIANKKIVAATLAKTGIDISKLSLRNTDDVSTLHAIISDELQLPDKRQKALMTSILAAAPDRKPNVIFDVTLKDYKKFTDIATLCAEVGYARAKIHIVWVVNDIEVAIEQNANRQRVVRGDILLATHEGAAMTMKSILNMGDAFRRYADGAIFLAFNNAKVDAEYVKGATKGSGYVKRANYVQVKKPGKPQQSTDEISKDILAKINSYIPDTAGSF